MAKQITISKGEVHKTFHSRMQVGRYAKQIGKRLALHGILNEGIMGGKLDANLGKLPLCAGEIIAYAAPGESLRRGVDIVDQAEGTIIPWRFLQDSDVLGLGKALVIIPKDFEKYRGTGKVAVIPQSIIVIGGTREESFMQRASGVAGKPHRGTMVPLASTPKDMENVPAEENLLFSRLPHEAVRTISRTFDPKYGKDAKRHVLATLPLYHDYAALLETIPKEPAP